MVGIRGQKPFDNYLIYGPILHQNEGRKMVVLIPLSPFNKRTSMSYARYLMAVSLGRELTPEEQVDHIDNDKLNDDLSNLQILTIAENNQKYRKQAGITQTMLMLICPNCKDAFSRRNGNTHLAKGGVFTACSRHCSGVIKRKIQLGLQVDLSDNVLYEFQK